MTTTSWQAATSGDWNIASNWNDGVPIIGVDAYIVESASNPLTVTFSTNVSDTAQSLSMENATLSMSTGTLDLQRASNLGDYMMGIQSTNAFHQSGGTIIFENDESLNNTSDIEGEASGVVQTGGTIQVNQGTLDILGNSNFAGTLTGEGGPTGGTIVLETDSTYRFMPGVRLETAALMLNPGTNTALIVETNVAYAGYFTAVGGGDDLDVTTNTFTLTGTDELNGLVTGTTGEVLSQGTLTDDYMTLGGGTLENQGTVLQGNKITDSTSILNDAGATYDINSNSTILGGGDFINAGTLGKSSTTGTANIDASVTSTGTILVTLGTLEFDGTNNAYSGSIDGSGTITFAGGMDAYSGPVATHTLSAGTALNISNVNLMGNGTTLSLAGSLTYGATFYENATSNVGQVTFSTSTRIN
jgi:hypothetical protein